MGLEPIMWNVTGYDWNAPSVEQIERKVTRQVRGGDVILLHDGGHRDFGADRSYTVTATDRLISRYKSEGYEFVTIPEMMRKADCQILVLGSQFALATGAIVANACFAAAMVWWTSFSVWAALRNAASNCDGGRYTPRSSMARKKRAKALVSHLAADVQSVTGPCVKNQVNIDPTRLQQIGTPASLAAAVTPSVNCALQYFQAGIDRALVVAQVAQSGEAGGHGQRDSRKAFRPDRPDRAARPCP